MSQICNMIMNNVRENELTTIHFFLKIFIFEDRCYFTLRANLNENTSKKAT
jgi:hypothetical protein